MNRVTAKSYTNDPANTPALTYGYDTEYSWQVTQDEDNPVGHLNSIMATLGTTNLTTWTSGDYDQRGNLSGYTNCLGSNAQSCPGYGVGTVLRLQPRRTARRGGRKCGRTQLWHSG